MMAFVNWNMLVNAFMKWLFRIITSRHAPVSYHPLQSPQSKIAVPEVWSNRLSVTCVFFGVLNKVPLARLFRIILWENSTSGVQVRFSIPKLSLLSNASGSGWVKRILKSFAPWGVSLSWGEMEAMIFLPFKSSMVVDFINWTVSPGFPHRNPQLWECIYAPVKV